MSYQFKKSVAGVLGMLALAMSAPACGSSKSSAEKPVATRSSSSSSSISTAPARKPAAAATRNPCDLVTKAEVEEALGVPVGEPRRRSNVCDFPPTSKSVRSISYAVRWTGGRDAMKTSARVDGMIGALGDKDVQAAMKKAQARTAAELEGLGDEASFQLVTLHVRKGDATLTIDARLCSRSQAIAVARKAIDRL